MKSYTNLYERVFSFENLLLSAREARKGKRYRDYAIKFYLDLEKNLLSLQEDLLTKTYSLGSYREFYIEEPKKRLISAAPYRDRVIHHALCNVIEPLFEPGFIYDSYACRKEKGTHRAIDRCQKFLRKSRYALKCDIVSYFPSIDHEILLGIMARKIRDRSLIELIGKILKSRVFSTELDWRETEDLFCPRERSKGIPIGNLTSQFFANVYLNELDHFVKDDLREKYYLRYVDDFLIFGDDKKHLFKVRDEIAAYLKNLRLLLHPRKSVVFTG